MDNLLFFKGVRAHLTPNVTTCRLMRLDIQWIIHNFVNAHFTTKKVPAVAPGILDKGLSLLEVFKIPVAAFNQ